MDVIDTETYTFESIRAFLLANDVPTKDAKREPVLYDGNAKVIHWTRFVRTQDGRYTFVDADVATERMVTPVKDGQEPKHHLIVNFTTSPA